ncbi:MAG: hypothetical protein DHS20C17_25460 [Cyclobacteriaceae bacterium]|nr:MAG: hypothetical protein DHS20C17_25460 [Cyclobacteriaceae bacterium]
MAIFLYYYCLKYDFNGYKPMKALVLNCFASLVVLALITSCQAEQDQSTSAAAEPQSEQNPPADGFDMVNSDAEAMEIADLVMEAMGGRNAWDNTRYLAWNFFGNRHLTWDKYSGQVRISFPDSTTYLVNVNDGSGKAIKDGVEVLHPDSLDKELTRAKSIWINDSYWLVMPFKLKDSGVTLKYVGFENTTSGTPSHVLELTFKEVGVTPQNRYLVYVDNATNLVNQWAFYREAGQDTANFVLPWDNYQQHGSILLSDNRGERNLTEVRVFDSLPQEVFTSLEVLDINQY